MLTIFISDNIPVANLTITYDIPKPAKVSTASKELAKDLYKAYKKAINFTLVVHLYLRNNCII